MQEVAELAGVAVSSVSRVLSNHPDVSEKMRGRVITAVEHLGYEPDFLAQSLRRGETLSVGFVVGDISNPLLADIVLGAESVLRRAGLSMLLMNSENDPDLDAEHIRFFATRRVDGMILSLASDRKRATIDLITSLDVPVVVIDRDLPARTRVSAVLSDHRDALRQAAQALVQEGSGHIFAILGSPDTRPSRERVEGIREAIHGTRVKLTVDAGPMSAEHGREAMDRLLELPGTPDAVILGSNQITVGALSALRNRGVVPGAGGPRLVACDETPLQRLVEPGLWTVSRDSVQLGRVAAELLLERLHDDVEPNAVVLPVHFSRRGDAHSNGAAAADSDRRRLVGITPDHSDAL